VFLRRFATRASGLALAWPRRQAGRRAAEWQPGALGLPVAPGPDRPRA